MDAIAHDCWSLPTEILVDILSLVSCQSVLNFEATCKAHPQWFEERDIYQRLSCKLFDWSPADAKEAEQETNSKINWRAEFTLSFRHVNQIRNNVLVPNQIVNPQAMLLMPPVAPNHFKWQIRRGFTPTITEEIVFSFQSKARMFPLPVGDFSVSYYEINIASAIRKTDDFPWLYIGVALPDYNSLAGVGRNSFAYADTGQVLLEFAMAPAEFPPVNVGDTVGFGIDFKKRSIFVTLNGKFICEKTQNYWDSKLLNLDILHATVSCRHGFELKANFGARPFVYDISKYYLQRPVSEKKAPKETFSIIMLSHLLRHLEEETLEIIAQGEFRYWSMFDGNPPNFIPKVNPFWLRLVYSNPELDDNGQMTDLSVYESLMSNHDLFLKWKNDKTVRMYIKRTAQGGGMDWDETRETYEEILAKLQGAASYAFSVTLNALVDQYYKDIRLDFIAEDSALGWVPIVTAHMFLNSTDLPIEHFLVQAVLQYLNLSFVQNLQVPINANDASVLVMLARDYIVELREKALAAIILEKNERKKEEYKIRDEHLMDIYQHRIPKDQLEKMINALPVPTPPPKMRNTDQAEDRIHCLLTNLIAHEHYEKLDDTLKASNIVETMCLLNMAEEQLNTEAEFVALAKKQITREVPPKKMLKVLQEMKDITTKSETSGLEIAQLAKVFGLNPDSDGKTLKAQIVKYLDNKINKLKKFKKSKKKKEPSNSLSTELLIGSGIGLLIGLGAAFFVYRWRQK